MTKRGVKPGSKRKPYQRKTRAELDADRAKRVVQADELLPSFLAPKGTCWSKAWDNVEIAQKAYLCSFAGLTVSGAAKILGCPESELNEAFLAFPGLKAHWDRGHEEIITACHVGLMARIRGVTVKETRRRTYFNSEGNQCEDLTVIEKELPPDTDAIKYFLSNRVQEYQETNPADKVQDRLDTMLGKLEQMDLFGPES